MDFWCLHGGSACLGAVVIKYAIYFVLFISSLLGAYLLGRSHSELKIVKEQVEVVKYVEKKKDEIYSRPNANRDELISLYKSGEF